MRVIIIKMIFRHGFFSPVRSQKNKLQSWILDSTWALLYVLCNGDVILKIMIIIRHRVVNSVIRPWYETDDAKRKKKTWPQAAAKRCGGFIKREKWRMNRSGAAQTLGTTSFEKKKKKKKLNRNKNKKYKDFSKIASPKSSPERKDIDVQCWTFAIFDVITFF